LNVEPIIIGEAGVDVGIGVRVDNPEQVGADRLVTTLGAVLRYDGPLIIIDSGTATTFDIVSADKHFEGGIIAPGMERAAWPLSSTARVRQFSTMTRN